MQRNLGIDRNWLAIPLVMLLVALAAGKKTHAFGNGEDSLVFLSGNAGGTFYYIAAGQAAILGKNPGLSINTQATGGSPVENLTLASARPNSLALVTADGFHFAKTGDASRGFPRPLNNLRILQAGHVSHLYALALDGGGVRCLADAPGKRIAVPPVGSSTYFMALAILDAHGCGSGDADILPMTASEQGDALKDGAVDIAFVAGGVPQATVSDLTHSHRLVFLGLDPGKQRLLTGRHPYWGIGVVPAGSYAGQERDCFLLSVRSILVCNAALGDELAFSIAASLDAATEQLTGINASGKEWNRAATLSLFARQPEDFHAGAARHYSGTGDPEP